MPTPSQSPFPHPALPLAPLALATVLGLGLANSVSGQGGALAADPSVVSRSALDSPTALNQPKPHPQGAGQAKQGEPDDLPSPPVPPLPAALPEATVPPNGGIVGLSPSPADDLGMGILQPLNLTFLDDDDWETHPLAEGRWLRSVALPLYVGPNGDHWGWIVNGWLMINGYEPLAIGQDASFSMVQAQPEIYSFPVLEQRADGWFRFQYTPAGSAWAHLDHLSVGSIPLTLQPWEETFATVSQVRFRRHGLSQALRLAPSSTASLQSLVVPNSHLRPLAIEGDWMRVEVTQPVQGCTVLPGHTTQEGWLRWRDEDQTLLIWTVNSNCPDLAAE